MLKIKRAITLIEIMVVIFIIGLIGSVVGVNVKKSMEKAKKFATEQAVHQIEDILEMAMAEKGLTAHDVVENYETLLNESPLAKKCAEDLLKDGWGGRIEIKETNHGKGFIVFSKRLNKALENEKAKKKENIQAQTSTVDE